MIRSLLFLLLSAPAFAAADCHIIEGTVDGMSYPFVACPVTIPTDAGTSLSVSQGTGLSDGGTPWTVSGTLTCNAGSGTQAVSLASMPTTPVTGTFWQATQPVSGTFFQATQPVSGTFWQATQPVSGTMTCNAGTGTLAVSLATAPALVASSAVIGHVIVDTTSTTAVTQATGTNLHAVLDTTSTTACTQATGTNLHVVTDATSVLAANQSVNISQINAVTPLMGTGATGTGSQRVTLATNSPGFSTSGGTIAADSALQATRAVAFGSSPTAIAATTQSPAIGDLEGRQYVNTSHPRPFNAKFANASTATLLELTGAAAVASNSYWITDITICGGVATAATVPALIQSGTGTNCGTATATWYTCWHGTAGCCIATFPTPIKLTAGHAICMIDATVGNKSANVGGFISP